MTFPGTQLEELCSQARNEVVLVAPFIKVTALARLLLKIPARVKLDCVTRWRPEEILAGVSDLEVWTVLEERPYATLWLRPDLHAKFYRADNDCLVGSANITSTALGWVNQINLELLVPMPAVNTQLVDFEKGLFAGSVQVNRSTFEQMQQTVQTLKEYYLEVRPSEILPESNLEDSSQQMISCDAWVPTLRNPEDLYLAYCGRSEELSTISRQAALQDLKSLPLTSNLSKSSFQVYVGSLLLQKPIIHRLDLLLEIPQRFGAVTDFLSSLPCHQIPGFDADRAWQTLMRWLRYFLPNRYTLSVPNHSEVFGKIKNAS